MKERIEKRAQDEEREEEGEEVGRRMKCPLKIHTKMSLCIHTHTQVCGLNGKSLVYHQSSSNNDERLTTTTTNHETSKSPLSIHTAHTHLLAIHINASLNTCFIHTCTCTCFSAIQVLTVNPSI